MKNVAIIDSGMGGLAVLAKLYQILPAQYHYYADNANMPYGDKSKQYLMEQINNIITELSPCDIDTVVLACNTLSMAVSAHVRHQYRDIKVYCCEPPIAQAVQYTASKCVLLATPYVVQHVPEMSCVHKVPAIHLATMIERCDTNTAIARYIECLMEGVEGFDSIVLGCTHYSFVKDILHMLYPATKIFDSVDGLVAHIKRHNKHRSNAMQSSIQYHFSAEDSSIQQKYLQKMQQFSKYY